MKVELSQFEVELLDSALTAWEAEPSGDAMMTGFVGAMLGGLAGPESVERLKKDRDEIKSRAVKESQKRRLKAALLRAKLLQALAVDSEHSVEENPLTPPRWKVNEYQFN
jgi:hypothetical protein